MLRVFTAFSGYDSQCLALNQIAEKYNFPYDLVGWSEIDSHAITAHNTLFPQYSGRNYGDISKIEWSNVPDFDLFTYSSPCQDFSGLGKQRGGYEGSGTRSSLLWECYRAIESKKPKYLLLENVEALVSAKFIDTFNKWQSKLAALGYRNYAKVLNAKNYEVPQSRARIFLVSILEDRQFYFPKAIKKKQSIFDVLEDEGEWVTPKRYENYLRQKERFERWRPCVSVVRGGVKVRNVTADGLAFTLNTAFKDGVKNMACTIGGHRCTAIEKDGKARKLTNRESYRLMGVSENEIDKLLATSLPKSAHYKLAGNSIVVNVLFHIFRKLFIEKENEEQQLTIW